MDNSITPSTELAVRSMNASSGRDAACVTTISERREQVSVTATFEKVSDKNNMFHELNVSDETREYFLDRVSEFLVSRADLDRQSHTHHTSQDTTPRNLARF